jgi:GAF domain-containing protein
VFPSESYSNLANTEDQQRQIVYLQHRASALESEISERSRAEEKLKRVKEELEIQLEDLKRLQEMSLTFAGSTDVEQVLENLLQATLEVHRADQGLLSVEDPERNGLRVIAGRGFDRETLNALSFIPTGAGACGSCFQEGQRVVIEDVEQSSVMVPFLDLARKVGVRACHSTPLITRDGAIIGALSIYFRELRRATEREKRLMDLYARAAADIIQNARLQRQLQ